MASKISLYDKVNLFEVPDVICNYAKQDKNLSLNTREKVINIVFGKLYLPFRGDYISKLLLFIKKHASAETPKNSDELEYLIQNLVSDGKRNEITDSLYEGCKDLVLSIGKQENSSKVYETLLSYCNFINFKDDSFYTDAINNGLCGIKEKTQFMFAVFRHAIINYRVSMPKFYCYRIYQEALTLTPGSEMQKKLFKTIADVCKDSQQKYEIACNAAIQYANLIYKKDYVEAYHYFSFAASKLPSAYWEIAFLIENHNLPKSLVIEFNKIIETSFYEELKQTNIVLSSSLAASNHNEKSFCPLDFDTQDEELDYLVCYKTYWVIARKDKFTKALNSLGKLLLSKKVGICVYKHNHIFNMEEESIEEAKEFLYQAMALGNTNALVNLANYYFSLYKKNLLKDNEEEKMLQFLFTAADDFSEPKACSLLGDYYFINNNLSFAGNYYKKSISHTDRNGYSFYMLGRIADLNLNKSVAIDYYNKAVSQGHYDAAYYSAIIWFNDSLIETDKSNSSYLRLRARDYVDKYLPLFSYEIQLKSLDLIKVLEEQ